MTIKIRQAWKDIEVTIINNISGATGCYLNFAYPPGIYKKTYDTWALLKRDLNPNEKVSIPFTPFYLAGLQVGNTLNVDADWRNRAGGERLASESSNQIVYQTLMVQPEVIIIPAEIITGVAMIKYIK